MAKIMVEFDTVEKTLAINIDGKAVPDVIGVSLFKSWDKDDEFSCSVTTKRHDEDNDMCTYTQLMAAESREAKDAMAFPAKHYPGFLIAEPVSRAAEDIQRFFAKD